MTTLRLAVTGAEGQIASALLASAPAAGVACTPLVRPALDLTRPDEMSRAIAELEPDVVINAAAYTAVDDAEGNEGMAFAINAGGAEGVARGAAACGAVMLQLSTDYVFGGDSARPYREDDPVAPQTVYGRSKLAGEQAALAANPRTIVLRTSWVYAPAGRNFVATMLRLAVTRDELGVVDDQIGCPTYAPHIAGGLIEIARQARRWDDRYGGVLHMAGTDTMSWCSFARAIFAAAASRGLPAARVRPITTAEYPTPAKRPANSALNCSKLAELFGVRLAGVEAGLEDYFRLTGPSGGTA